MTVPSIGGARGIFEIFVPGAFLLLNLSAIAYLFPFSDLETKNLVLACASNPAIFLVVLICFGYLIGVILRLFKAEPADRLSGKWNQIFNRGVRKEDGTIKLFAIEDFPFIGWIGEVCKSYLPPEALDFYNQTWALRRREGQNRQFFNFCKNMINSEDDKAANEIYAAESLSRYISSIFYSLLIASCLISVTVILQFVLFHKIMFLLLMILLAYIIAITVILKYFRFIRVKEVEAVFAATFKNRTNLLKGRS